MKKFLEIQEKLHLIIVYVCGYVWGCVREQNETN